MSRHIFRFLLAAFCVVALSSIGLAAADEPVLDPADPPVRLKKKNRPPRVKKIERPDDGPKKDDDAKPALPEPEKPVKPKIHDEPKKPDKKPDAAEEERKKLVERILKNLDKAEQKLAKNDPGATTREIQRDVLKDLDRLIEQTRNQPPPQGGSSSRSQSRRNQQKAGRSKSSGSPNKTSGGAKENNPKEARGSAKKPKQGDSGGKNGSASAGGKANPKDKNKLNDLFKDIWGHLPETMRQEMDAYSRARFLPEYDLALKQYYRTLSEQGRKK